VDDRIFIGSRSGRVCGVEASLPARPLGALSIGAPIRQTAAYADAKVFVTAEDLKVRCFEAATGKLLWTSDQLSGQSARDYYPIIVRAVVAIL
jgi:outer membrane protein assembly factor BamB